MLTYTHARTHIIYINTQAQTHVYLHVRTHSHTYIEIYMTCLIFKKCHCGWITDIFRLKKKVASEFLAPAF